MHTVTVRKTLRKLFSILGLAAFASGCVHFPPEMTEKGMVAWSYESRIAQGAAGQIPVSLRVADLKSDPPDSRTSGTVVLGLIPLISLANLSTPTHTHTNVNIAEMVQGGDAWKKGGLRQWEVEEILRQEIRKSGLANEVFLARDNKGGDFEIKGSVNFVRNEHTHVSGFGILYIAVVPMLVFPLSTQEINGTAHFDVVSAGNGRTVLSKDYTARTRYVDGIAYSSDERGWAAYGREVFPQIVEQFIADLKALPRAAWR